MYKSKLESIFTILYPHTTIEKLNSNQPVAKLLNLDSLNFVKLIIEIEEQFNITFMAPDIYDTNITFSKILDVLQKELQNDNNNSR